MKILIATTQVPFVRGGAEALAEGLQGALRQAGHQAEIVALPFKWYPAGRIPEHMLACRLLDLTEASGQSIDLVIGLKFPAYLVRHPHKVAWLLHQHRQAYEMWDGPYCDLKQQEHGMAVREAIQRADGLLATECRSVFTISATVSNRLWRYNGVASAPLYHPPPDAERFFTARPDDYLYFPSRLSAAKRQELVLRALAHTRLPVRVHIAGQPDADTYEAELHDLAESLGVSDRVGWLGAVDPKQHREAYARCRGVVYPPFEEDLGYVTLEAMLSAKPVVTVSDAGGPLEFVRHERTGLVAEPHPESLAVALDRLWAAPADAAEWGLQGRQRFGELDINWANVVRRLLA